MNSELVTLKLRQWSSITSDKFIIETVKWGLKIEFISKPVNKHTPQMAHSAEESEIVSGEIAKLLKKRVIKECDREKGDFISTIFTRRKKDGGMRTILNLKQLNKHVTYQHFKMAPLSDVFKIIQPNCWMASVDLKDSFYTIPIHNAYQKYFKFMWHQKCYKYLGMPNGYSDAMRVFTKMLKPLFATLRKQGFISVIFADDSYLQGSARSECRENVHKTVSLLASLGFTIHQEKSFLEPTQCIEFLVFIINSADMAVKINPKKSQIIIEKIKFMYFFVSSSPIRQTALQKLIKRKA